jgi:glycosyltransferase involved in cell wall biosynthesis
MRVLQIGSDRSKRGILFPKTPSFERQKAYADRFGRLDIIGFSRKEDGAIPADDGVLHTVPTNSSSKLGYLFDALRIAKSLPRPDVVSAQDPFEAGFVAWLIARRFKVPLHVQVHTDLLSTEYAKDPIGHSRRLLARFVLNRATRVRVVSERIKVSLQNCFHLRIPISVLPIFVDVRRFRDAKVNPDLGARFSNFKKKLLVVSRLEPEKNVELAIRAFAAGSPADTCLIIVGEGSERKRLELFSRGMGVSGRTFFEGERDAAPYYTIADLVLVPSKYEGYGLVIVEALAAGKPVLATDVGIVREAGAIVSSQANFAADLERWFDTGSREGVLKAYPYESFEGYVRAYCDDIAACIQK